MNTKIATLLLSVLFISCGSSTGNKNSYNNVVKKHIYCIEDVDEYNLAYTDEGHMMIFFRDSVGNNIVYFVKFENGAGKYGLKGIEEKIIRTEIDSSLTSLNSFVSVTGGAFCESDNNQRYNANYFDEQLKGNYIEHIGTSADYVQLDDAKEEDKVKRLTELLNVAYSIAHSINENKVRGWDNIAYALESVQCLLDYDVIVSNTIYDEKVKKRVIRIWGMNEELTSLNIFLREKITNLDNQ